jgi:SAM-dependent methyltransferase
MLKLDIGCGRSKRFGFTGIDVVGEPDVICDVAKNRLPFDDASADYVYSAHCIEHIDRADLMHVFQEMTRVCADGGTIEIWHPHMSHSDAFVFGHISYLSEAIYDHLGCSQREFWTPFFGGAQWVLEEVRYGVDAFTLEDIRGAGMSVDFAVSYLREIIKEIGVFVRIGRNRVEAQQTYRRSVCTPWNRADAVMRLSDGPRQTPLSHDSTRSSLLVGAGPGK